MQSVLLLLGANMGDVNATLDRAIELLAERAGEIKLTSSRHITEPWGFNSDLPFTNQGVELITSLEAEELLDITQTIERELGRNLQQEAIYKHTREERYAPRVIDIDIILFGDIIFESERLTTPHPQMAYRDFVLRPLCEIAPKREHPITGDSIETMLRQRAIASL